ncbi:MAG: hypothetical protein ACLQVM_21805 [Terriglobia bacterium]
MTKRRLPTQCRVAGAHSRREFLQGATAMATGLMAAPLAGAGPGAALPTVALGPHRVTRLIAGSNPLYGYSHFNRLLNQLMAEYFTDERKIEFLLNCQKAGINTWQTSYNEPFFRLLREAGWKMNWLWLADLEHRSTSAGSPDVISQCRSIPETERPLGMVHHGETTDVYYRDGKLDRILTFINAVHDLGLLAGISTHNPRVVEAVEEKGWSNDFYMTCFYRESRRPEEFEKEIGVIPVGETYLSTDPPRMCEMIRRTRKPCLGFKILAAGRRCGTPEDVRKAFEFAFQNIKPSDGVIVGMYPRYTDQISENVGLVRELAA